MMQGIEQKRSGRAGGFRVVVFAVIVGCLGLAASAQESTDSLVILEGLPGADSAWVPKDSLAAFDMAAGSLDSLVPEFVGFGEGERLVYSIQYGIINAGEATLEIRNIAIIDSTPCYNIVSNARTNDVFSVFYKVRDRYVSFMDTTELVSLRYEKHLRECNDRRNPEYE